MPAMTKQTRRIGHSKHARKKDCQASAPSQHLHEREKSEDEGTYGSLGSVRRRLLGRILPRVQQMGWQTALNTRKRVLSVQFFRLRRSGLQIFLKELGVFIDAVHGCTTTQRIGSAPTAIARSHHVVRPTSEQFCGSSQVSRRCVETMALAMTEGMIGPTLVCFVACAWLETTRYEMFRDSEKSIKQSLVMSTRVAK